MAELRFDIIGTPKSISLTTYALATQKVLGILRELDTAISRHRDGVLNWYVSNLHANGTLALELYSKVRISKRERLLADVSGEVVGSFVTGLENIEQHGTSPPYLSESGIKRIQGMVALINRNGAKGFKATDHQRTVDITEKAVRAIGELLPPVRDSVGSVEGRIEEISIHRKPKFVIYHAITKKAITCQFHEDAHLGQAVAGLGQRVIVFGNVFSNARGEPVRVEVNNFEFLRPPRSLPLTAELTGSDPNFTGDLSTDEYIRRIRRG